MDAVNKLQKAYIISHSSMDLVSVLSFYERYKNSHEVTILISSTAENYQFLQSVNIPERFLKYIHLASNHNKNKKNLINLIHQLSSEKKQLDKIIAEISADPKTVLYFHSYDNDPQCGYLVAQIAQTNQVTLVDILGIKAGLLSAYRLLTVAGIKTFVMYAIFSFIFGRHFVLTGTRSLPMISLNLRKLNIAEIKREDIVLSNEIVKYKYPIVEKGVNIVFNYVNPFGVREKEYLEVYAKVVKCLKRNKYNLLIKVHPQGTFHAFPDDQNFVVIPKYVPFELVDLTNVSMVVGIYGASLLCTGSLPTVSIIKMLYQEESDFYLSQMNQLSFNKSILFVNTIDELETIIRNLG